MTGLTSEHLRIYIELFYESEKFYCMDEFLKVLLSYWNSLFKHSEIVSLESLKSQKREELIYTPHAQYIRNLIMENNNELIRLYVDQLYTRKVGIQKGKCLEDVDIEQLNLPHQVLNVLITDKMNWEGKLKKLDRIVDKKMERIECAQREIFLLDDSALKKKKDKKPKKKKDSLVRKQRK